MITLKMCYGTIPRERVAEWTSFCVHVGPPCEIAGITCGRFCGSMPADRRNNNTPTERFKKPRADVALSRLSEIRSNDAEKTSAAPAYFAPHVETSNDVGQTETIRTQRLVSQVHFSRHRWRTGCPQHSLWSRFASPELTINRFLSSGLSAFSPSCLRWYAPAVRELRR